MDWDLSFITQEEYKYHVREFYTKIVECTTASTLYDFNRNIIDPIKLTFSYFTTGEDISSIVTSELTRQQDKTINNSIGYFHQQIFNYIDGWEIPNFGFDIVNREKHIFVELKNKHNTMNSASSQKTYINMQSKLLNDDQATCMLVEVIAKRSQNIPWVISLGGQRKNHNKIRRVSIDKFYEIATGDSQAFRKIVEWLPLTLKELVQESDPEHVEHNIIEKLEEEGSFFLGLYKLAFGDYVGFDKFTFKGGSVLGDNFKK